MIVALVLLGCSYRCRSESRAPGVCRRDIIRLRGGAGDEGENRPSIRIVRPLFAGGTARPPGWVDDRVGAQQQLAAEVELPEPRPTKFTYKGNAKTVQVNLPPSPGGNFGAREAGVFSRWHMVRIGCVAPNMIIFAIICVYFPLRPTACRCVCMHHGPGPWQVACPANPCSRKN